MISCKEREGKSPFPANAKQYDTKLNLKKKNGICLSIFSLILRMKLEGKVLSEKRKSYEA